MENDLMLIEMGSEGTLRERFQAASVQARQKGHCDGGLLQIVCLHFGQRAKTLSFAVNYPEYWTHDRGIIGTSAGYRVGRISQTIT